MRAFLSSLTCVLAACLLAAGAAQAEIRTGALTDAAGDATAPPDAVGGTVTLDTTAGTLEARIQYAAAPPAGSNRVAAMALGTLGFTGRCERSVAAGGAVDAAGGEAAISGGGTASSALEGTTIVIRATGPALAADLDCALIEIAEYPPGSDTRTTTDYVDAVALTLPDADGDGKPDRDDRCPTQPSDRSDGCPAPAPTPPTDTKPAEQPAPVPPKPRPTAIERYDAAVAKCVGKTRSACLKRAKKTQRVGYLQSLKRKRNPFMGKAYLNVQPDVAGVCGGSCIEGWTFVDDRFVYRGEAEDGPALVRCTKVTAVGDKDGCLRYRLSADRRTATVGTTKLKLGTGIKLLEDDGKGKGDTTFFRVAIPPMGARYDAALDTISSFGIPGVNQIFNTGQLQLNKKGQFANARQVSGTSGQGTDLETNFVAIPAEQKGTYEFEAGGTLYLKYASGREVRYAALVGFGPKSTLGRVPNDGLFLDGAVYLPQD